MNQPSDQRPSYPPYDAPPTPAGSASPGPFAAEQPAPKPARRGRRRLLILLFFALLAASVAAVFGPLEIAAWHLAAAQEERAAGNKQQAYERLADAMRWSPKHPGLLLQRAVWRVEDGQSEAALDDANQAVELSSEDDEFLMLRAQILQHLDRHAEAIQDWKTLDRLSLTRGTPDRATALNGLAYARAVGKLDLNDATKNVEEALEFAPGNPFILDTRGYLLYLQGEYAKALTDMDAAVKGVEASPPSPVRRPPTAVDTSSLNPDNQGIAVVRYHRALVLKALGRENDAQKDLDRARQLIGREPDEKLF